MRGTGCVILNYNDAETTAKLVSGIRNYKCFDAIVVVDNNSSDGSYDELRKLCNEHIYVLSSGKNGGYGFGNNVGIRFCRETLGLDFCMIANPDVIFSERFAKKLIAFMNEQKDCALVSGKQKGAKASAWRETGVLGDALFNSMLLNRIFRPRYYPQGYFIRPVCEVYAIPGCLFLARLEALYEIGLYDEEFFLFEEEKILAKRLKEKGWKNYVLTDISYIHNHSVSIRKNIKKTGQIKRLVLKSNRLYLKKYCRVRGVTLALIRVYHEACVLESVLFTLMRRFM